MGLLSIINKEFFDHLTGESLRFYPVRSKENDLVVEVRWAPHNPKHVEGAFRLSILIAGVGMEHTVKIFEYSMLERPDWTTMCRAAWFATLLHDIGSRRNIKKLAKSSETVRKLWDKAGVLAEESFESRLCGDRKWRPCV